MPVWLTLFLSLLAVAGLFGSLFFLVVLLVEGRRAKAKPRLGIAPGSGEGIWNIWVNWDPTQFDLSVYRIVLRIASPYNLIKEGTYAYTFNTPQNQPFVEPIELPAQLTDLIRTAKEKFLVTLEFKTTTELTLFKTLTANGAKALASGKGKQPSIANVLPVAKTDAAPVWTLDFEELEARKQKLKDLEAQAKAKAKAAPPKPAAAAAPAPAAPAPAAATGTPTPAPAPAATAPAAVAKPEAVVKSVRDVVSASNAKKEDKTRLEEP